MNKPKGLKIVWWVGVPIIALLSAWGPYWIWSFLGGSSKWWRVPAITPGIFDTYVYLHWMGAAANGLSYGGHLKWFGSLILRPIWIIIGNLISLPELWIISRWIALALTLWIGAWSVKAMSGLSRWPARVVIIGFWLSLFPLSLRPGMYSWYLPFCILGLMLVYAVYEALKINKLARALGLSLLALLLTNLYPWFLMTAGIWLAAIWAAWLIRRNALAVPILTTISVVGLWLTAGPLAQWFLDPARAGLIGMYERNGMTFARVPFFSNTILAIFSWIALLLAAVYSHRFNSASNQRLTFNAWGWIVILLLWFNTPFTGIHIYSDHFIAPVAILAWLSMATVWSAISHPPHAGRSGGALLGLRFLAVWPAAIACGASLFFFYVLQQPLRSNIWKFDSYVIHLAHWFALSVAAWLIVWRQRNPQAQINNLNMAGVLVLPMLAMSWGATAPVILRDLPKVTDVRINVPVIEWIRAHVPATDMLCADPETASFYAAHTGRRVNPAEATLSYPEASTQVIQNLKTLTGAYSVTSSGNLWFFQFYTDHYRTIPCAEGSKYSHNAGWFNLLQKFGYSTTQVNELIGCRQAVIDVNRALVNAAIGLHRLDAQTFGGLCPWVIVPDAQAKYWQLPEGYVENRLGSTVIWQKL